MSSWKELQGRLRILGEFQCLSWLRNASLSPWLKEEVTETLLVEGEVTTWMLTGLKHPSVKSFRTVS